jgi:alpha-galactosidase
VYLLLLCDSYHDPHLTRVQVLRKGMEAIREGFGRDRFLMSMPPAPITGVYANGMRIGSDCAPVWSKVPGRWPWGGVETLTNAARRYYFAPYMWAPDPDCAYFGLPATRERWQVADQPPLTEAQSIAWLTGAALTGGVLKIGDAFADLSEHQVAILRRLLPVWDTPARPIDLFRKRISPGSGRCRSKARPANGTSSPCSTRAPGRSS